MTTRTRVETRPTLVTGGARRPAPPAAAWGTQRSPARNGAVVGACGGRCGTSAGSCGVWSHMWPGRRETALAETDTESEKPRPQLAGPTP